MLFICSVIYLFIGLFIYVIYLFLSLSTLSYPVQ
jgi:hypothetical protein